MIGALLRCLSPAGARAQLQILIFHRVLSKADPLFPGEMHAARFDALCGWLRRWFNVLPLDEAVRRLGQGSLPERAAAITFDDGYADNHDVALPVLASHRLSATFFVATGFLDGGTMWNDTLIEAIRLSPLASIDLEGLGCGEQPLATFPLADADTRRAAAESCIGHAKYLPIDERLAFVSEVARRSQASLPSDLMMRSEQVVKLYRAGMGIGAHTVHHPILATLGDGAARDEIVAGRDRLEALIGARVSLFAYPNGKPHRDYGARCVRLVREAGFDAAVSTAWGVARADDDRFQLPRFTPWDRGRLMVAQRLLRMQCGPVADRVAT